MTSEIARAGCQFASDNASGVCPEAWEAMASANAGCAPAYGEDEWTQRASDRIREAFETDCEVFFTFNGTAANSLALAAMCQSYHSIICTDVAHIEVDECGGPEFYSNGSKILTVPSEMGKLTPQDIALVARRRCDVHYPKPSVVSITQSTEVGTCYSIEELAELGIACRELGLHLHMDGARVANAIASLDVPPKEVTWQVGVDVLCLGGTKNGLPVGDAVVFFNKHLAHEFEYRCKQAGQLASKMRYLTAPWVGILEGGAWLKHARYANAMARSLADRLNAIPQVEILFPCEANAVFVRMPSAWSDELKRRGWIFYDFVGKGGARFMCSWATTPADVDALEADVRGLTAR